MRRRIGKQQQANNMKTKTSELIGPALDWAVAKCEGMTPAITSVTEQAENFRTVVHHDGSKPPQAAIDSVIATLKPRIYRNSDKLTPIPSYSTDWSQGGPIIDRLICKDGLVLRCWVERGQCEASLDFPHKFSYGSTPLIAAMRCYIASKFGDEVEVPDELA